MNFQFLLDGMAKPSFQNFCPQMTFIYNIPDLLELKQLCIAVETQNKCQVIFVHFVKGKRKSNFFVG